MAEEQAPPKTARLASITTRLAQTTIPPEKRRTLKIKAGTVTLLNFEHPPIVSELIKLAYEDNWVRHDFNWTKWIQTAEAQNLLSDPRAIEQATTEQLTRLLTAIIRQDRFVDGAIISTFESGLLLRVLKRIRTLDQKT